MYPDRVRTATPNRPTRGLKPSKTAPGNPGHIKVSGLPGAVHDARVAAFETVAAFTGFGLGILNSVVGVINLLAHFRKALPT